MEIKLGIIGQGGTGKTELIRALQMMLIRNLINPGPSLEFAPVDHQSAKAMAANFEKHEAEVGIKSPPRTADAMDFEYALKQGGKTVGTFVYHDAIGQLLDIPELDEIRQNQENAFIEKLALSNVLWALIPIRVRHGVVDVDDSKIHIIKNYILEAIRVRQRKRIPSKISLAVVITRSELIGSDTKSETIEVIKDACTRISKHFTAFVGDNVVIWSSVLFPVSAFGFDNFIEEKLNGVQGDGNQGYYLACGTYRPWNLSKLLLWSLCASVEQPAGGLFAHHSGANSDLASRLAEALSQTEGPALPLKKGTF